MKENSYYVYILSNTWNTVLYVGVTNDLARRCYEHKSKKNSGFTQKYQVSKLVYFESYDLIDEAIAREKQMKKYSRIKKEKLIEIISPRWLDLYNNGTIPFMYHKRE